MSEVNPAELDLPTLASLAGSAANEHLLRRLHEDGYAAGPSTATSSRT